MIPIVEDFILTVLKDRFKFLKENPDHLDKVLKMNKVRLEELKTFIACEKLNFTKGYPRLPNQLPTICVLLSTESERQDGFGDWGTEEDGGEDIIERTTETASVIYNKESKYPYPYFILDKKPVLEIFSIRNVTQGYEIPLRDVFVMSKSQGEIALPVGVTDDEDEIEVDYTYAISTTEDLRTLYDANFRIEAWTNNADLTVELYHLIKWAMLASRDQLSYDMGLFNQKLGGADFSPVPAYFPEFVYRRALSFWCEFNASIVLHDIPYITDTQAYLHLQDKPNIGGI